MVVINFGYSANYVVNKEDAMTLIGILERALVWEEKYVSKDNSATGKSHYLYHAYPNENMPSMKIVPNDLYDMAKLAGKPIGE